MTSGELFTRFENNPLITADDLPYPANSVFNPAAVLVENGDTVLLLRVEDFRGRSHLTVARSPDGISDWTIENKPALSPDPLNFPEESWGIEDPRVTWLESEDMYAITYTAYSERGPLVFLATTGNFSEFERIGAVLPPENKDAALFPVKFNGRWAMLHRPMTGGHGAHIWLSMSPDLRHWGDHRLLLKGRSGSWWDAHKIGVNCAPLPTPKGWLIIYHGVRTHCSGALYRLGLALLDKDDPSRVIARSDEWIMGPRATYEMNGDVGGVVFPCGWTLHKDTNEVFLYYGGADTVVCLARAKLDDLLSGIA